LDNIINTRYNWFSQNEFEVNRCKRVIRGRTLIYDGIQRFDGDMRTTMILHFPKRREQAMYSFANGSNCYCRNPRCTFCRFPPINAHLDGGNYYADKFPVYLHFAVIITLNTFTDNEVKTSCVRFG